MTFYEKLMMGSTPYVYAQAEAAESGGAATSSDDIGEEGGNEGNDTATESGKPANNNTEETAKNKDNNSLMNGLDDGDGITFDFSGEEKPEGFPDEYWDVENKRPNAQALFENLRKQEKISKDLRAKMGKGAHKAPDKPEGYKLELSEEVSAIIPENDPLIKAARERAHAHGMSQETFQGFVADIIGDMQKIASEIANENSPMNEEARAEYIKEQIKAIGPNGPQVLRAVQSWANELKADGVFNEQDVDTMIEEGLVSARMVQMFNRLRTRMAGSNNIPMDTIDDGLPPDSEIAEKINAAYESKDPAKIRAAEQLLDKRRAAGRPERLQF